MTETTTPVSSGDKVLWYDDILNRWQDAVVIDALASQFTIEYERTTGGDRDSVLGFDFLFYADKGVSWKSK